MRLPFAKYCDNDGQWRHEQTDLKRNTLVKVNDFRNEIRAY